MTLLWVPVLLLHPDTCTFAELITYEGMRAITALLTQRLPQVRHVQACSLGLLVGGVALLGSIVIERAAEAAAEGECYAGLMQQMAAALEQLRAMLAAPLGPHLPVSVDALPEATANWLRGHAAQVQL